MPEQFPQKFSRREAVLASLALADPDQEKLRFLEVFGQNFSTREQAFLDFIEQNRGKLLLTGKVGGDLSFLFSPRTRAGYWVVVQKDGLSGKGFLGPQDLARLLELAAQRGFA